MVTYLKILYGTLTIYIVKNLAMSWVLLKGWIVLHCVGFLAIAMVGCCWTAVCFDEL